MRMEIGSYFSDRSVLITGASGFVGKVLLEKLLRDCPLIRRIFIILRSKSGHTSRERLSELFDSAVFDRIRRQSPSLLAKVTPITGDVTFPELGISPQDRATLIDTVSIVFHSAATVRFDEPLKRAVQINVTGTQRVLTLAHKLKHLEAFVHVSTAYCNTGTDVEEVVYSGDIPPQRIIDAAEWMNDDLLSKISSHLFAGRPSSYHYTKALAEQLVAAEGNNLPLAIVRPSIVTCAWKEPIPGWIDNYNGPSGYFVVAGKGILRTMRVHGEKRCDLIPVDIVTNTCIAAAWYIGARRRPSSAIVVNCTSGEMNAITWHELRDLSFPLLIRNPSMEMFRYPSRDHFHASRFVHRVMRLVQHTIPALFVDFLFRITGHKPILRHVYEKVHRTIAALEFFTTREWRFRSDNQRVLVEEMSAADRDTFYADIRRVQWSQYMETYVLGVRAYLLKEDPRTIGDARARLKRLYYASVAGKSLLATLVLYRFVKNFIKL